MTFFGITRMHGEKNIGWWVRLGWSRIDGKRGKPRIQKSFPDARYGSLGSALDAAIAFRDAQLQAIGPRLNGRIIHDWKGRSSEVRRKLQDAIHKQRIYVGTGIEGAQKAYALGMSRVTCWRVQSGQQAFVTVNNGGWRTSRYEVFPIVHEPDATEVRYIGARVKNSAPGWMSADAQTAIVCDILEVIVTSHEYNLDAVINSRIRFHILRGLERNPRRSSLNLNGDLERPSDDGKIRGLGLAARIS